MLQAFAGQRVHAFRMAHPLDKDTFVNRILTWFHRINGKVTLVAAAYNMTLGVRMLTTDPILLHGLTVYLCLIGTVFAIAETRKQLFLFRFHRVRARRTSKHGCVLCCAVLCCVALVATHSGGGGGGGCGRWRSHGLLPMCVASLPCYLTEFR